MHTGIEQLMQVIPNTQMFLWIPAIPHYYLLRLRHHPVWSIQQPQDLNYESR